MPSPLLPPVTRPSASLLTTLLSLSVVGGTLFPGVGTRLLAEENDRPAEPGAPGAEQIAHFERRVRPLLIEKCVRCHGEKRPKAGLRLDSGEALARGGESGRVVVPGDPEKSLLIRAVRQQGDLKMPPKTRLEPEEIAALVAWVEAGAIWPGGAPKDSRSTATVERTDLRSDHWAFQPVRDPAPPATTDAAWPTSPIDSFVLARLEEGGLRPSPPEDRRRLMRRVTFDLTGLPPTPDEIDAFASDDSPGAYRDLVERLLASPHYGERWGRHWLDIARFGESAAHDGNNAYLYAWRYRDYVIRSFNADKPYDRFIVEQLAGDLLPACGDPAEEFDRVVATGFLQIGPKPVVMRDKKQMLLDIADEQLHTTGVAFMAMTVGCARCHDHKFDPIPTRDYYSLAGIFTSTHTMADAEPDSMWVEYTVKNARGEEVRVMAVRDLEKPADLRIHRRGNYRTLGEPAPRGFLRVVAGSDQPPIETGSGRLELARWIASPDNPLTARVMVNRIWQHHFGRGIVASSDDFGARGEPPTHPRLLDWLAMRFVESGWSVKEMHRLMVLSSTYRQSSDFNAESAAIDPAETLFWRMPRRRLDAEEVRDAVLAVSGGLDPSIGGNLFTTGYRMAFEPRKLSVVEHIDVEQFGPFAKPRRSVYMPMIRNVLHPMLRLFDAANEHESSPQRHQTTVAPQALFLMNNPFVRRQAAALSTRILEDGGSTDVERVEAVYLRVLGRRPTDLERSRASDFFSRYLAMIEREREPERRARIAVPALPYSRIIRETPGLVAYYRLDEEAAGGGAPPRAVNAVAPERSPGVYDGGATFAQPGAITGKAAAGDVSRSIALDGSKQFVRFDDPQVANVESGELTVEYWVRPDAVRLGFIVGRDGEAERYWKSGLFEKVVDGARKNVVFHEYFGGGRGGFRTRESPEFVAEVGEWTHVAFTYGKGRRRLYVNGRLVDELPAPDPLPTGSLPISIGARLTNSEHFQGSIDEVALYDRVLDEDAVRLHHLAGGGREPVERDPRLMAWRSFCQALLCMNEFIYID